MNLTKHELTRRAIDIQIQAKKRVTKYPYDLLIDGMIYTITEDMARLEILRRVINARMYNRFWGK